MQLAKQTMQDKLIANISDMFKCIAMFVLCGVCVIVKVLAFVLKTIGTVLVFVGNGFSRSKKTK